MIIMNYLNEGDLDLNLLVTLDVLLSERSVTRAAQRLGVTQPAVSHRLRILRERLEDPLLVGSRRDLVLTERAKAIAGPLAQALIDARAALRAGAPFDAANSARTFLLSTNDFGEMVVIPRVLEFLRVEAPGVKLFIRPLPPDPESRLASGQLELVVGAPLSPQAGLLQQVVGHDDLVVLMRKDHPLLRRGKLSLDAYLRGGHIVVSTGRGVSSFIDEILAQRGLQRTVSVQIAHFVSAPFLIARSDLFLSVGRSFAKECCRHLPLTWVEHPLELPVLDIFMTWHERFQNDGAHAWFRGIAARITRECMPRPRSRKPGSR